MINQTHKNHFSVERSSEENKKTIDIFKQKVRVIITEDNLQAWHFYGLTSSRKDYKRARFLERDTSQDDYDEAIGELINFFEKETCSIYSELNSTKDPNTRLALRFRAIGIHKLRTSYLYGLVHLNRVGGHFKVEKKYQYLLKTFYLAQHKP